MMEDILTQPYSDQHNDEINEDYETKYFKDHVYEMISNASSTYIHCVANQQQQQQYTSTCINPTRMRFDWMKQLSGMPVMYHVMCGDGTIEDAHHQQQQQKQQQQQQEQDGDDDDDDHLPSLNVISNMAAQYMVDYSSSEEEDDEEEEEDDEDVGEEEEEQYYDDEDEELLYQVLASAIANQQQLISRDLDVDSDEDML